MFLILALVLAFNTIWNTVHGLDNQIFETIISMTFSFYFAQKGLTYAEPDSLVKEDEGEEEKTPCVWFDLDSKEENDGSDI